MVTLHAMAWWFVALTAVLTLTLHARTVKMIGVGWALTMMLVGYIQFFVWDDWRNGLFTSHWMYMTLLLRAGTEALRGDGYPVSVHPVLGTIAALALGFIALHETMVTHLHAFHNYVHVTIYATGLSIALGASSQRATEWFYGEAAGLRVRAIRQFLDPAFYFSMGLLLVGHQHDPAPLSMGLHATFGYFLITLGCASFLCSLVHDVLPAEHPACAAMRRMHAFGWILSGGITYTMCAVQYLTPGGGFKSYLDASGIRAKTDFEELVTYVAATVLGCSFHLALLHLSTPTRDSEARSHYSARVMISAKGGDETMPMVDATEGDERELEALGERAI